MKAVRGALFDLGSNSIKFMLAEQRGATLAVHREQAFVTRLAENLEATGRISDAAMKRSLKVLKTCCREAGEFGALHTAAVGTSALRSAENGREFIRLARLETGLAIRTISGKAEGELVFGGISSSKLWARKPILAVDIGGGSVEFVAGRHGKISFNRSLPLGCVRVRDHCLESQPVPAARLEEAAVYLRKKISRTLQDCGKVHTLVASGGTASALAWLQFPPSKRPPLDALEGFEISLKTLDRILGQLAPLSAVQIQKKYRLPPGRADIVVAGAVILRAILLQSGQGKARFASRGLRYGLWLREIAPQPFHHVKWQALP